VTPESTWRDDYFNRVRPVVGEDLERKRIAVWDLGFGYLAAEALARTGLRRQVWLDGGAPGGAFSRSLGRQTEADDGRCAALLSRCRAHNHWETDWQIEHRPAEVEDLERALEGKPDLLLARGGGAETRSVAAAAADAGVPLVMTFVPRESATSVQVVWLPETGSDPGSVIEACTQLGALPQLDLDQPANHTVGLEARSMALALARWILSRPGDGREDLERAVAQEGRSLIVRGRPDWPWSVRFLSPDGDLQELMAALSAGGPRYSPPLALLRSQRLLVLGLGTASLFCAEACWSSPVMVLVDAKEVSVHNPVRQVYGTDQIGRPKSEALASILSQRLDPYTEWTARQEGEVSWLTSANRALGAVKLHLTAADPDAEDRFAALLDQVRPTLVVVGMGRTRDDNFLATYELRRRGIRHITPSAFPGVTHFKHIVTDGESGPCYDCLQGHLAVDAGPGPSLTEAQRELFYGGTQPATLAETYPSAHSLLRLAQDLALPRGARPPYLLTEISAERPCFVGANRAERAPDGSWLYGVDRPFAMVSFGVGDVARARPGERCSCGRVLG
jgi:hypothetical protein